MDDWLGAIPMCSLIVLQKTIKDHNFFKKNQSRESGKKPGISRENPGKFLGSGGAVVLLEN